MEEPGPSGRLPVLVVQADPLNRSRIPTVVVIPLSNQLRLSEAPGNVVVPARASGLLRDTVAVVSGLQAFDRRVLRDTAARIDGTLLGAVDEGLRLVLGV